jgi:DNA modification methylase
MSILGMDNKEYRKLSELHSWDKNPRAITKEAYERLKWQIQKLGMYKPSIINQDNIVLGGNMRLKAYAELGIDNIWVSPVITKNESEMWEYALSDNDHVGVTDMELIVNNMPQLDIDWTKYSVDIKPPENLQDLIDKFTPVEEDEVPEVLTEAISKLGEVYQLGRHRLMCGDATKIEDVEKLMDGQKADMVFTDPPYNVDYSGRGKNTSNKIENDNMSMEDFYIFLGDTFRNYAVVSKGGACIYICHADGKAMVRATFEKAFNDVFTQSCTIIWKKNVASMGWQDYRGQHEPILYGWNKGEHQFYGDRSQTTVWDIGREGDYKHPTQKPVALVAKAIKNSSKEDDIVLDLFGGSGSTLIACEQTNRTCYMMELDPKYCDVIRKRYDNFVQNKKETTNGKS